MNDLTFRVSPSQAIFQTAKDQLDGFFAADTEALKRLQKEEVLLCLVEAIQNARVHSGKPQDVRCSLSLSPGVLIIKIWDRNPPFSLHDHMQLPADPYAESGRGLVIIQQLVDGLALERYADGNCLTLTKYLEQVPLPKEGEDPLDLLYEVSESIVQAGEVHFDRIYQLVLDKAIQLFGVDRASIMNFDAQSGSLKIVASRGLPESVAQQVSVKPGEGVSGVVFKEAKAMLIGGKRNNRETYKSDSFISAPMLCSPMRMGSTCIGVINVTERRDGRPFEEKDLKLLTTLANQAAAYVRIAHLIEQVKESQKIEQELAWARRIQLSLAPQEPLSLPYAEAYGYCEMASQMGGDYFDYIRHGRYLYVVIADVSGHNLPAALTMVNFRSALRSQIGFGGRPADILQKVATLMFDDLAANEQQITVALVRLDPDTREVLYANAGHPPLLWLSRTAKIVVPWKPDGIILGAVPQAEYEEVTRTWQSGDQLLFYTDGVVEAADADDKPFGQAALTALLVKYRDLSPAMVVGYVLKETHRHTGAQLFDDDLTLVQLSLR